MRRVPSSRRPDFRRACAEGHSAKSCGAAERISENFLHLNQEIQARNVKTQQAVEFYGTFSIRHTMDVCSECVVTFLMHLFAGCPKFPQGSSWKLAYCDVGLLDFFYIETYKEGNKTYNSRVNLKGCPVTTELRRDFVKGEE